MKQFALLTKKKRISVLIFVDLRSLASQWNSSSVCVIPLFHLHASIHIQTWNLIERKNTLDPVSRTELKFGCNPNRFTRQYQYAEIIQFQVNNKAASMRITWRKALVLAFYYNLRLSETSIQLSYCPLFLNININKTKIDFDSQSNHIEYLIIVSNLTKKLESGKGIHSNAIHKWNTF